LICPAVIAAEVEAPAASEPAAVDRTSVRFVISGTRVVRCHSRWHDLELPFRVSGRVVLPPATARELLPPAEVDGSWQLSANLGQTLASSLYTGMTVTCDDKAAAARWLGSQPREERFEGSGRLTARLADDQASGPAKPVIELSGRLGIEDSRTLAGRFGPNWQQATWKLTVIGNLGVDPVSGRVVAGELDVNGGIVGKYFTKGGGENQVERYTETVKLNLAVVPPPTPETLKRVAELIRQMGDDSYQRREQATEALRKIGDVAIDQLRVAAAGSDPEIAVRARMLLRDLDPDYRPGQPAASPTAVRPHRP
jgi:hypothetical protein